MSITLIISILKFFKKYWWILPLIGIGIYIFILNTKINSLEGNIKDKDRLISIQKQEIEFNKKTIENQKKKIEALEEQAERNKDIEKKYKPGQTVKGKIIKFNNIGAFAQIDKGIHGLIYAKDFDQNSQSIEKALLMDQSYDFQILSLIPTEHKMALKLVRE